MAHQGERVPSLSSQSKYLSKLNGARVLIIGGSSGIGYGIAEALLEHGASVVLSSSSQRRVESAIATLSASYPSAARANHITGLPCDLSTPSTLSSDISHLFTQIGLDGKKLDHVIFTAGDALAIKPLESFTLEEIQQAGMVRFFAPLLVAQHLRQHLNPGPQSSYTLTTGGLSQRPRKDWAVVMSYLTGLEGMSRALARDLAPIRVNLVGPGPVNTDLWKGHQEGDLGALKADLAKSMATGKFGEVEDVVEAYVYLLKDANATGSIVYTNGGGLLL